ncbi:MAG: hypothetical protein ACI9NT_001998, partial [Bacteroidia bacterium]
ASRQRVISGGMLSVPFKEVSLFAIDTMASVLVHAKVGFWGAAVQDFVQRGHSLARCAAQGGRLSIPVHQAGAPSRCIRPTHQAGASDCLRNRAFLGTRPLAVCLGG